MPNYLVESYTRTARMRYRRARLAAELGAGVQVRAHDSRPGRRDAHAPVRGALSRGANLTNHPGEDFAPAWSPDGSKIAFASSRADDEDVYVMNSDGTDELRLTTDASRAACSPLASRRWCAGRPMGVVTRSSAPSPSPYVPSQQVADPVAAIAALALTGQADTRRDSAMIREWRQRRRLSQLELALQAGVSSRHLSFVETGRSRPSAAMVLHLAEQLEVPLRDRNHLLLAAGYAPVFAQHELDAPELGPIRDAIDQVLGGHEPYPALVVDRHWGLVAANRSLGLLVEGVADHLLQPPINVLRLSLHPDGMASRILNLHQWRAHLLERLSRDALTSGDPALTVLHDELAAYPGGDPGQSVDPAFGVIAVPLRLRHGETELAFISTNTTFGTAVDVTVAELSIESFFPADQQTANKMHSLVGAEPA